MKAKISAAAAVIMGLILVFITISMYQQDIGVDLKNTTRVQGVVTRAFDTADTEEADLFDKKRIFAFQVSDVPQTMGTSERAEEYDRVRATLKPGTPITMYYRPNGFSAPNMDIYQLEKGNEIIIDYKNQEKSSWWVAIMMGLLAIYMLVAGIAGLLKKEKRAVQA
jgi:hypothetical protein